jgi:hypothetical protein
MNRVYAGAMEDTSTRDTTPSNGSLWKSLRKSVRSSAGSGDPKAPGPKEPGLHAELPAFGQAYLALLIAEFATVKDFCANDDQAKEARNLAQDLVNRAEEEAMTWGDAYMLETAIAQMLPTEYLHQRGWCLEVKYRDAVGNADAYDAFKKAEAEHLKTETPEHLRARIHNIIRELYRLYTVIDCRENMRQALSKSARNTLMIVFGVLAGFWVFEYVLQSLHLNLIGDSFHYGDAWSLVFAAGSIGGVVSLQRRIQSLPRYGESLSDLVELTGRMTVKFTPIIGGIFAVVLFLVFQSGLVEGPLFPKFTSTNVANFVDFIGLRPASGTEWGKLLVWSFIAGFAEKFVPDTLDRLIARSEGKQKAV